jgi:predicted TIM-barrel fold metal-dependent hydrolase
MYDGPIVDSHHHLWEWRNYPWLVAPITPKMYGSNYQPLRQDYLVDDLRADFGANNVVKSVHVQANYDPSNPVGETRWLQAQADRHGFPHAIVGHAVRKFSRGTGSTRTRAGCAINCISGKGTRYAAAPTVRICASRMNFSAESNS